MLGLHKKQLAASLAVVKLQTAAEAKRLATKSEAVRRDQKSRKSSGNYHLPAASGEPESDKEEDLNLNEVEKEKLMATLADLKTRRGSSTERQTGRRKDTTST